MADCTFLLNLRNDETSRQMSSNTKVIDKSEHLAWLESKLSDACCEIYIYELAGNQVGMGRIDASQACSEKILSWAIHRKFRGQGLGFSLVANLVSKIPKGNLIAFIKPENMASSKIASKLGFVQISTTDVLLKFKLEKR